MLSRCNSSSINCPEYPPTQPETTGFSPNVLSALATLQPFPPANAIMDSGRWILLISNDETTTVLSMAAFRFKHRIIGINLLYQMHRGSEFARAQFQPVRCVPRPNIFA